MDFLSQNGSDSSSPGMLVKPSYLCLGAGTYSPYLGNTSWLLLQFLKHLLPPSPTRCVLCFSFSISLRLASAQVYSNSPSWEPASCPHQVNLWEDTGLESICKCVSMNVPMCVWEHLWKGMGWKARCKVASAQLLHLKDVFAHFQPVPFTPLPTGDGGGPSVSMAWALVPRSLLCASSDVSGCLQVALLSPHPLKGCSTPSSPS